METSTARAILDPAATFYVDALQTLHETGIPFLIGGAVAVSQVLEDSARHEGH